MGKLRKLLETIWVKDNWGMHIVLVNPTAGLIRPKAPTGDKKNG